jgi:hypothetical protein
MASFPCAISAFADNYNGVDYQAKNIASRVRPHLPLKSGESLTFVGVNESSGVLVYEHTLDVFYPPENEQMIKDWLRGQSYKSACSVRDLVVFIRSGGALYYRFFYSAELLHTVKIERC